jgi:threonine dehydratase
MIKKILTDVMQEVLDAEVRIRPYIIETPLEYSPYLSRLAGCEVYLKLENMQATGSFKYRGAINFLLSLNPEEREKGVITSSTGNHGAAFVYACKKMGYKGTLYLPENVSPAKLDVINLYGAEDVRFYGTDTVNTERVAKEVAEEQGAFFLSPYNDTFIIGGQGTISIELIRQLEHLDAVFVPVGGGGLMTGMAVYLKEKLPGIEIIGCQPKNSPVMYESIKAGHLVEMESKPTLSEGTSGGIEPGAVTFDYCCKYVDHYELLSETELEQAILLLLEKHYLLMEGAGALSLAAFLNRKEHYKNKTVVLVITGRKINMSDLKRILSIKG